MKTLGIIPARKGSKRCPGKNLEKVGGETLLARAWSVAGKAGLGRVLFMTDIDIERMNVPTIRPPDCLLDDDASVWDALRWTLGSLQQSYDAICILQPTSPLRTAEDVSICLRLHENHGCAMTVTVHHSDKGYRRNGICYVVNPSLLSQPDPLTACGWVVAHITPPERSIDIDTPEDLELARKLWQEQNW